MKKEEYEELLDKFIEVERENCRVGSGVDMFYEKQVIDYVNKQRPFWIAFIKFIEENKMTKEKPLSDKDEIIRVLHNQIIHLENFYAEAVKKLKGFLYSQLPNKVYRNVFLKEIDKIMGEFNHSPQTPQLHSYREKGKGRKVSEKVVASRIGENRLPDEDGHNHALCVNCRKPMKEHYAGKASGNLYCFKDGLRTQKFKPVQDVTTGCLEELEDLEERKGWGHQKRYEKKKGVYIERAGNITKDGFKAVQAICGTDERYSNYVKETTKERKGCGKSIYKNGLFWCECGHMGEEDMILCSECEYEDKFTFNNFKRGKRR